MEKIPGGGDWKFIKNGKNSGGGWKFIKKCWTNCLADLKDRSIEIV